MYLFGAFMGFILTTTCDHLIIYSKDLKYFTLNVILSHLYFIWKIASFSHFKPTFAKLLHKRDYWGLIWHPRAPLKVPVGPLDLESHYFLVYVSLGGVIGEKIENLALKSDFEAVLDFRLICFSKYAPLNLLAMVYPIILHNWYL